MKIAMLAPIAWRTPPVHYGPWELVTSLLTEELVKKGVDVTLFATADSVSRAKLKAVCSEGYEENKNLDAKVWECLHISECFEHASEFDLIHNQFDFLPLSYSKLVNTKVLTTIHGFSSPRILPVYQKYNRHTAYVSISNADRSPLLDYAATIYHGIDLGLFHVPLHPSRGYLLFLGRIHPDKGAREAIDIAVATNRKLLIAGIVQDHEYFKTHIQPRLNDQIQFTGTVGPAERNRLMGNAEALLHPIHFKEPFGLAVVEAMACGTPVIAFNKGSMPEIIQDGITGFLVENVNQATDCITQLKSIDSNRCRKHVELNFSKERMAADYLELYRQLI